MRSLLKDSQPKNGRAGFWCPLLFQTSALSLTTGITDGLDGKGQTEELSGRRRQSKQWKLEENVGLGENFQLGSITGCL